MAATESPRCPTCHQKLAVSTSYRPPYTIVRCRDCNRFAALIEGIEIEWIEGGPGAQERLERSIQEGARWRAFLESAPEEPWWGPIEGGS